MAAVRLRLLVALALVACCAGQPTEPFDGVYTSSFGETSAGSGFFYLCNAGTGLVQGAYSEVGFVYGTVSNVSGQATFSGLWFEAGRYGYVEAPGMSPLPSYGPVQLSLSADMLTITGTYNYAGSSGPDQTWFTSTFVSGLSPPTALQCWSDENVTADLNGEWNQNSCGSSCVWDICLSFSNRTTGGSYTFPTYLGYSIGNCFLNGRLCTVDWYEDSGLSGIYIVRLLTDTTMIASYWDGTITSFQWLPDPTVEQHGVEVWTQTSSYALACGRNTYLGAAASLRTSVVGVAAVLLASWLCREAFAAFV